MTTSSDKHARQKANKSRLEAALHDLDVKRRRRRLLVGGALAVVVIAAVTTIVLLTGKSDDEKAESAGSRTSTTSTQAENESTTSTVTEAIAAELPAPPVGKTLSADTTCPPEEGSTDRVQKFAGPPPDCLEAGVSYSATFETTEGTFTATLDRDSAPKAVNNFVVLSRYHFYDGVPFHRIMPGFVIQGGDGDGAPWGNNDLGYSFEDELPSDSSAYTDYSLAMANSGADTNGSQFFVVLPGGGSRLAPSYTAFGQVTEGQDIVDKIGKLGNSSEEPTKAVVIDTVKITES